MAEMTAKSSASSPRSLSASVIAGQSFDPCAAGGELFFELLVAAIEMVNAIDDGLALSREPRQHERDGCAEIGRHYRGAGEARHAAHHRRCAMDIDVGAHATELRYMHEAVLEDGLGDHRRPFGRGHRRHHLCL